MYTIKCYGLWAKMVTNRKKQKKFQTLFNNFYKFVQMCNSVKENGHRVPSSNSGRGSLCLTLY